MKPSLVRNFLLIFAGTFAVLLAANWAYYFHTPFHEQGDAALNALQINHAKSFHELYGNYSRFRFHHPGPAFFYVYAWAELLLCDTLKTGLAPYNAHSIAGLAVQTAFFALGLSIAAQWVKARLFLPLALLAAAIHFAIAGNAFWSIWPPHVLLMPFLAFWLACLSMACGRGEHLTWVVLAGSMLVHGHVAQPLFVVSLFSVSYGFLFFRQRGIEGAPRPWRLFPRAHLIAAIILVIFCAPLVIDLFRGNESNFSEILRHVHDNTAQLKKPAKSFLYLLSFFGYVHNQDEVLRKLSPESLSFFRENWPAFVVWSIILGLATLALPRLRSLNENTSRFWDAGLVLWSTTIALGVIWGILQTGRPYEFNSYFFYSITYLALFPPIAWLAGKLELHRYARPLVATILFTAGITAAWAFSKQHLSPNESGTIYFEAVQKAIAADPLPNQPILLAFDQEEWPQAATVALALQRLGHSYYVDDPWWFMFSRQHTVPDAILRQAQPEITIWRLLRVEEAGLGLPVGDGVMLVAETPSLNSTDGLIDFSQHGNYLRFLTAGYSNFHGLYAWMCQDNAVLQFLPGPAAQDVELDLAVVPYLPPDKKTQPPVDVFFNGQLLLHTIVLRPGHLICQVPRSLWERFPVATLRLSLAAAQNPFEPGLSHDHAFGSLSVRRLVTRPGSR